jgi:hypothetical protein
MERPNTGNPTSTWHSHSSRLMGCPAAGPPTAGSSLASVNGGTGSRLYTGGACLVLCKSVALPQHRGVLRWSVIAPRPSRDPACPQNVSCNYVSVAERQATIDMQDIVGRLYAST